MLPSLRALGKVFLSLILTFALLPFQLLWLLLRLRKKQQSPVVRLWFRIMMQIIGIRYTLTGELIDPKQQSIVLSNHISYLDIVVTGALFTHFFVAKLDIAGWPIFGFLSKISGTIFISRQPSLVKTQMATLQGHLDAGKNLLIFPEGTTSNGSQILPFKNGLIRVLVATPRPLLLYPVSLAYTKLNNKKLQNQADIDVIAWYGTGPNLVKHLWLVFQQGNLHIQILVHPPLVVDAAQDAKYATQQLQNVVTQGFDCLRATDR